jgi:mRNA interferase HigB
MHVISQKRLREFWGRYADAETPLRVWWTTMKRAPFGSTHDVREAFSGVDLVGEGRAVFDIGGNEYRLVADIRYEWRRVFIVAVLTHEQYDQVGVTRL